MSSWSESLAAISELLEQLGPVLQLTFEPAVSLIFEAIAAGKKVLCCGNGGSCAQASHLAAELLVRFRTDRRALSAVAFTDVASLTACANDYGYTSVFARAVEGLANPGDVLVVFSTSGESANVNEAVRRAKHMGIGTLGISGKRGITAGTDVDIVVPSTDTARIQEAHQVIIHLLCEAIDERLPKGEDPKWKQT